MTLPGSRASLHGCRSTSRSVRRKGCARNCSHTRRGCRKWRRIEGDPTHKLVVIPRQNPTVEAEPVPYSIREGRSEHRRSRWPEGRAAGCGEFIGRCSNSRLRVPSTIKPDNPGMTKARGRTTLLVRLEWSPIRQQGTVQRVRRLHRAWRNRPERSRRSSRGLRRTVHCAGCACHRGFAGAGLRSRCATTNTRAARRACNR